MVFQPAEEVGRRRSGHDRRRAVRPVRPARRSSSASTSRRSRRARWPCVPGRRSPRSDALRVVLFGRGGARVTAGGVGRPGRDGRGDRDAAAGHRVARGGRHRHRRGHRRRPPRRDEGEHHPGQRGAAGEHPHVRRRGPAAGSGGDRADRPCRGRRVGRSTRARDRADRVASRPWSTIPRRARGPDPASTPSSARAACSTRGWSPPARTSVCWPRPPRAPLRLLAARRRRPGRLRGRRRRSRRSKRVVRGLPSNHSPLYAPVIDPTLDIGVRALVSAVHTWLPATAVS